MNREEIARILEEVRTNGKAAEELRRMDAAAVPEEAGRAWAGAAAALGHRVTAGEIREYILEAEAEMKRRARETGEEIRSLSDEELGEVAGGKDHSECKDTYKDRENCWFNDGCDIVNHHYKDYKCHYDNKDVSCGKYMQCMESHIYG